MEQCFCRVDAFHQEELDEMLFAKPKNEFFG